MIFAELEEEVYTLTNRRAWVAETRQALISAARHYHSVENWGNDRVEAVYTLPAPAFTINLDKDTVWPNLRVFEWMRKWDPAGIDPYTGLMSGAAGALFRNADASAILDSYGRELANVYYELGSNIRFISTTQINSIKYSYLAWPTLYPYTAFNSWFMDKMPELLAVNAALRIAILASDAGKTKTLAALDLQNYTDALTSFATVAAK